MKCTDAKEFLSCYMDGALTGKQMAEVNAHLATCEECRSRRDMLACTHRLVAELGRKPAPPDLALRLRVAIAHEAAKSRISWYTRLGVHLENALNGFLVPATAGTLSAMIFFGLLIGFFAAPPSLRANDVPTTLYTPPELRALPAESAYGPFAISLSSIDEDAVVVEAYIDEDGRVQDYRLLSAPGDLKDALPQLANMLIFTRFRPATSFGRPVWSKAVLSLSKVNVKG